MHILKEEQVCLHGHERSKFKAAKSPSWVFIR